MSVGVSVASCVQCGHRVFPDRFSCPACGGHEWRRATLDRGTIEAVTALRRAPGRQFAPPVRLGTVQLRDGPKVIARLDDEVEPGAVVSVAVAHGVVVARLLTRR
jgi:uncharacterized OB-fold protein